MSDNDLHIMLIKTEWCPHCQHFKPIYKEASKKYKDNKELGKLKIEFSMYDGDNDVDKINKYKALEDITDNKSAISEVLVPAMNAVNGYPTILIKCKKDKAFSILHDRGHTADDLLEKILDFYNKEMNPGVEVKNVQKGGSNQYSFSKKEDGYYAKKYLKYKTKYLTLKK